MRSDTTRYLEWCTALGIRRPVHSDEWQLAERRSMIDAVMRVYYTAVACYQEIANNNVSGQAAAATV